MNFPLVYLQVVKKYSCMLIYMVKSTDWFKKGPSRNKWFRHRLQICIFSGLVIGWWSKLWAAHSSNSKLSTPRVKYSPFKWAPFEIWFPKKKNNYIFQKKIIWTTQKDTILHVTITFFPKTRANKNKQWTHYSALNKLEIQYFCHVNRKISLCPI